jgi:hypothetical protein
LAGRNAPPPSRDFIIPHFDAVMKKNQINILLITLIIFNILDGDFLPFSVLDAIKLVLFAVCFYLNNRKECES